VDDGAVVDSYETKPTLTWTCESGPTKFSVVINDGAPVTVDAAGLSQDATTEKWKWDRTCKTEGTGDDEKNICTHEYVSTELPVGTVTWKVSGTRGDIPVSDDLTYEAPESGESSFVIFGPVQLTIATDVPDEESIVPGDPVKVTVSLDNQTNGEIPLTSLKFAVDFNDTAFTAPIETDLDLLWEAGDDNIAMAIDSGKLSFEITGELGVGKTSPLLAIPFMVKTATPADDYTFKLSDNEVISGGSNGINPPEGDTLNPSAVGGAAKVTVEAAVAPGDVDGSGLPLDLADAILPLQVAAGIPPVVEIKTRADVDEDDKIGVVEAAYVLRELAK